MGTPSSGSSFSDRQLLVRRTVTLLAAIGVSSVAGSNYAFGAWAPQFAKQLNMSSTQINLVGTAGNLGVYISGPLWGIIVDSRGPRINLATAAILLLGGYLGIKAFFDGSIAYNDGGARLGLLCAFNFCTGAGSSAGLAGAVNTAAKSFPDTTRATATGVVLAGFGLSAFIFSTISHAFFPGNTSEFLGVLAFGCFFPMFLGIFLVTPVPVEGSTMYEPVAYTADADESGWERIPGDVGYSPTSNRFADEDSDASDDEDEDTGRNRESGEFDPELDIVVTPPSPMEAGVRRKSSALELSPTRSHTSLLGRHEEREAIGEALSQVVSRQSASPDQINICGRRLFGNLDFWILAGLVSLLSGTGLMWINNCGLATLALFSQGGGTYDPIELGKLQATQVSVISLWNCAGRIIFGVGSDLAKHRFAIRRIWFMSIVSTGFLISQVIALGTTDVHSLWIVSTVLGVSYGGLFGLAPVVCLEWFGLSNFSLNWGLVSMAPVIGGNISNLVFGHTFDAHTAGKLAKATLAFATRVLTRRGGSIDDGVHDCTLGRTCYLDAFKVTTTACALALALSIFAGWRRETQSKERKRRARLEAGWATDAAEGWGVGR